MAVYPWICTRPACSQYLGRPGRRWAKGEFWSGILPVIQESVDHRDFDGFVLCNFDSGGRDMEPTGEVGDLEPMRGHEAFKPLVPNVSKKLIYISYTYKVNSISFHPC